MKSYLVAYSTNSFIVKSCTLNLPNRYSLVHDSKNGYAELRKRVIKYCKPCLARVSASPESCGGGVSVTEYSNEPLGVESVDIMAVSRIVDD